MRRLLRTAARLSVAVIASGAAIGIALTVGIAEGTNSHQGPSRVSGVQSSAKALMASAVPSDLGSSFPALNSSSTPLPDGLATSLGSAGQGYGLNPTLGRQMGTVDSQQIWLVPGSSGSCLEVASGGTACASNATAEQDGLWLMLKPVSGASPTIYGIAPAPATLTPIGNSAAIVRSGEAVVVKSSSADVTGHIKVVTNGSAFDLTVPASTGQAQ